MAVLAGKLAARRRDCAPVAGKSTLNRLELSGPIPSRYHKIGHDPAAIEGLFVDLFLEAHTRAPKQIILDLDVTDARPAYSHSCACFAQNFVLANWPWLGVAAELEGFSTSLLLSSATSFTELAGPTAATAAWARPSTKPRTEYEPRSSRNPEPPDRRLHVRGRASRNFGTTDVWRAVPLR